jgi:hypothetical protein
LSRREIEWRNQEMRSELRVREEAGPRQAASLSGIP